MACHDRTLKLCACRFSHIWSSRDLASTSCLSWMSRTLLHMDIVSHVCMLGDDQVRRGQGSRARRLLDACSCSPSGVYAGTRVAPKSSTLLAGIFSELANDGVSALETSTGAVVPYRMSRVLLRSSPCPCIPSRAMHRRRRSDSPNWGLKSRRNGICSVWSSAS